MADLGDLERDTRLEGAGSGLLAASLSPCWEIWGPNGGYLAAIVLRAAGRLARIPRPVSLHVHYLRQPRFAPVSLQVNVLQTGRRAESISVLMTQDERPVLTALVRTAAPGPGLVHSHAEPPSVEGPEELPDSETLRRPEHRRFAFWDNFERRVLQPQTWAVPRVPEPPRWLEWYRYRSPVPSDEPFLQAARLAILIDTLCWPAAWLQHTDEGFIAPSLDLTVWFHREPHGEWLLSDARAPVAEAGLIGGTCQIWSEQRTLLASGGSQLLCLPNTLS